MLWGVVYPLLCEAIHYYDQMDSLPETRLIGPDRQSRQRQIDQNIDALILELKASDVIDCRDKIKSLREAMRQSREQMAEHRACRISAPTENSLTILQQIWEKSRESYDRSIAIEEQKVHETNQQVAQCRERFRDEIPKIGIQATDDEIDYLLMSGPQDDYVAIASAVTNMIAFTSELERLTDKAENSPL
jgi:hypothetical protein